MPRRRASPRILGGRHILAQFCIDIGLADCTSVSLYDHHNVVGEMSEDIAIQTGVHLDHLDDHCSLLLSHGFAHRREAFDDRWAYHRMIELLDGYIFIDVHYNRVPEVHVYQDDWMKQIREDCIVVGVTGDKGQVAQLLNKPAIIFDDRKENVLQVIDAVVATVAGRDTTGGGGIGGHAEVEMEPDIFPVPFWLLGASPDFWYRPS